MTDRTRNIAVGLTGITGLVVLALLLVLFGYAPRWLDSGYELHVRMDHAGGLRRASRVTFNGIDVGEVVEVRLTAPPQQGVLVTAHIDDAVQLPVDVQARVEDRLLGGSPALALTWTHEPSVAVEYLPTDGSAVIQGDPAGLAQTVLGQLSEQLAEPMAQIERLTDSFERLSEQWTQVGYNINLLVQPRSPELVDGDEAMMGNLASMVARADARMAELRQVMEGVNHTLAGVQAWLDDEELRDNVAATVSNARELTQNLNEQVTVLSRRYVAVADDLSRAIRTMDQTLEQARSGDGTVGKLLNDPALYNNLNDAAERLNLAMDELNLLLEKFRTEGLPLQFE